jgi:hypothetical protein
MDWANILEGTIGSLFAFLISTIVVYFFNKFISQRKYKEKPLESKTKTNFESFYKNPFLVSLFITSFLFIITFFSFVFLWSIDYSTYLTIASFIFGIITFLIYENHCPNCKKIFHKNLINKITLKDEKRPFYYRDLTIYLYSDGSEKERRYSEKEKTRMETWRTEKEFYECTSCSHKWDKIFERNLDKDSRPKPNIVRTKIKPPDDYDF